MHGIESLLELGGNDNALARSKTIGLNHQRSALSVHVVEGQLLIGKRAIGGSGDTGALHQLLGKKLGALHLRGLAARAKARDARGAHGVCHAGDKRGLGTNDDKANAVLAGKARHLSGVVLIDLGELGLGEDAAVAGGRPDLARARALEELAKQRVLAAASAQKEDVDRLGCVHGAP